MGRWASPQRTREAFPAPRPLRAATAPLAAAGLAGPAALRASPRLPLMLAGGFLLLAGIRALWAFHDRLRLRRQADLSLQTGVRMHRQSRLLVWRAAELTGRRESQITRLLAAWDRARAGAALLIRAAPLNRLYLGGRSGDLQASVGACFDALDRGAGPARSDVRAARGLRLTMGGGR